MQRPDSTARRRKGRLALAALAVLWFAAPAAADGAFVQLDVSPTTLSAGASMERGNVSVATGFNAYTGGADLNLSVTYKFLVGDPSAPVTFRLGPAFQYEGLTTPKFGVRAVAEHYRPTSFGHIFLLGEFTTIDTGYFGLVTVGFADPDVDFEFTVGGDNKGYSDQSIAATIPVNGTKARLRAGYRFQSREVFAGISLNTF